MSKHYYYYYYYLSCTSIISNKRYTSYQEPNKKACAFSLDTIKYIIVMYIHSLSSFCAYEPVSISANKDILILLLLAQMKRMLQTWAVIVHDVSNSYCGPPIWQYNRLCHYLYTIFALVRVIDWSDIFQWAMVQCK